MTNKFTEKVHQNLKVGRKRRKVDSFKKEKDLGINPNPFKKPKKNLNKKNDSGCNTLCSPNKDNGQMIDTCNSYIRTEICICISIYISINLLLIICISFIYFVYRFI